ncbi:sugar transporter STL1-like [Teratosphaeria destructans]|uniref:Sugar transporter STL1-like n=1 Tax=Teratosphaeria destructans TaxID=418781 RepID=A0A9W7STI1_9PEZI|nr:sugar transporter STL1-like [Teratosphaeria destructans]
MVLKARFSDNEHGVPHYMSMTGSKLNIMVSVVATCGFLLFGYDQGVMSGIISGTAFNNYFPQTKGDTTWQAFVTAIYEIGCLFGAIFQLIYGDRIGRRRAIIMGASIMIIGVVIQVTAFYGHHQTAQFIVGRVVTGIGNGINTSTIPTYQAECSRSHNRGLLICIEGGIIAFGTLIAYWIDYGASYGPDDLTWRFPIAFQIVFGLVIVFGMVWLPESPRWLLTRDRHEEATTVLAALRGTDRDHEDVKIQAGIIMDSIRASGHVGGNTPFSSLLTGGKNQHFRRMALGASSQFFQQIGGCNAVIYYFPVLFENSLRQSKNLSLLLGGVNMIVYAIFATTSWFIIERVGRRKLFLAGSIGQCLSMVLIFACLIPDTTATAKGAAVGFFTYIAFFGATWLPLPWLYPAEINPIKTRAKANAVSTISNWLWNFTVVMFTPPFTSASPYGCYLFFALCNALFVPVIYFFYPETAGRSLEEIDLIFAKGYLEHMSYVRAAKELPHMTDEEIDIKAKEYGFQSDEDEAGQVKDARFGEKEAEMAHHAGGLQA